MRHPLVAIIFLLLAAPAFGQGPLDLFPQDAVAAVAIRDLDGLIKKGDKFLNDTEIRVPLRPSDLFDQAVQFLGANKGLNRRGSAALRATPASAPFRTTASGGSVPQVGNVFHPGALCRRCATPCLDPAASSVKRADVRGFTIPAEEGHRCARLLVPSPRS